MRQVFNQDLESLDAKGVLVKGWLFARNIGLEHHTDAFAGHYQFEIARERASFMASATTSNRTIQSSTKSTP